MGLRWHTRLGKGVGLSLGRAGPRLYASGRRGWFSVGSGGARVGARLGGGFSYSSGLRRRRGGAGHTVLGLFVFAALCVMLWHWVFG